MDRTFNNYMRVGDYQKALDLMSQAVPEFYRIRWSSDTVRVLLKNAQAYRKLTRYTEARRYCKQALLILTGMLDLNKSKTETENIELIQLKAHANFTMGRILWEIGNTADASAHFTDALEIYIKYHAHPDAQVAAEMRDGLIRSVQYEGVMRFRIREFDQALAFLDWAEAQYRQQKNLRRVLSVLDLKARIYRDQAKPGSIDRAHEALAESLTILNKLAQDELGVDKYAQAECYLTYLILEYQESQSIQDKVERMDHLAKAESWYHRGVEIAKDNAYVLLRAVYEGIFGNILFDRLLLQAGVDERPDLKPAFDQYLEECFWDTRFEKRRFFRSLDFLVRRLSELTSDEIRHYVGYMRERWQAYENEGRFKLTSFYANSGEAEYMAEMKYFCSLMEEFSEYIAQP